MASIEERVRTAAANYAPLVALLSSGSPAVFRWFDTTLVEGVIYPAVVAMVVSNPPTYVYAGRTPTSFSRMQLTVWGGQWAPGAAAAEAVTNALLPFFDQLDLVGNGRTEQQNNLVVMNRRGVFVQTDTPIFQRILDVRIFSNDTL